MRVFRSGELQRAVLAVLDERGDATGYTIMQTLADRLGGRWRPSPGAVYPALLGLEDAGLVVTSELDGTKTYRLSPTGRSQAPAAREVLGLVEARVRRQQPPAPSLGALLDAFVARVPHRRRPLDATQVDQLDVLLRRLSADLDDLVESALPPTSTPPKG